MKRTLIGRRGVLGVAGAFILPAAAVRAQGAGVALVIGNSRYLKEAALPNPKRDTTDVAARFRAYGLQTELLQDADRVTMEKAVADFGARAKGADFAAFYYAGHGVFFGNGTWMVPVEGDLSDPENVKSFVVVAKVRDSIKDAQNKLMVFDATPAGMLKILQFMADLSTQGASGSQQGGFPQIGGLRFSIDEWMTALFGPDSGQPPSLQAMPAIHSAPGATPMTLPTASPATAVPWPARSTGRAR